MGNLKEQQKSVHDGVNAYANISDIKQLQMEDLKNTKSLSMIELNTLANIASIKLSKREILKNTKSLCMIKSNAPANIADIKQLQTED